MFYDTRKKNDHGLPHDPFKAIVAPRPIGWITSISAAGKINLAPYSWFNGVSSAPPMVMFSSEQRKDSLAFIEETKEFVCNFATYELREQVNQTSAPFPRGVNEMEKCGLAPARHRFHAADHARRLSRLLRHNAGVALLHAPPDRRGTGLNQGGFRTPAIGRHDG